MTLHQTFNPATAPPMAFPAAIRLDFAKAFLLAVRSEIPEGYPVGFRLEAPAEFLWGCPVFDLLTS